VVASFVCRRTLISDVVLRSKQREHREMAEDRPDETVHERLTHWRVAERGTMAARAAQRVADLALAAAHEAEEASLEAEAAARAAAEAATRAQAAAQRTKTAAANVAVAAQLAKAAAAGDQVRANQDVKEAEAAETWARDAFHESERKIFPKE
jgi:hypothetical protein